MAIPKDAVAWRWSENNGQSWFAWRTDWEYHSKAVEAGCLIEYALPNKPEDRDDVKLFRKLLSYQYWHRQHLVSQDDVRNAIRKAINKYRTNKG